jgi:hypothetical protein
LIFYLPNYDTDDTTVGVPQLLVRYVVDGGKYVTTVVGAVPKVIPVVAVPPDIDRSTPGCTGLLVAENQVVVKINCVALFVAFILTKSPV